MPKVAKELTPLEVKRLSQPGLHAAGGVAGLLLQVTTSGAKSWVLRAMVGNKRRDIGLGGYPTVPLATARDKAREARELIAKGIDPVEQKKAARAQLIASQGKAVTFKEAARDYIATHQSSWKNAKHAAQWTSTLETYAYPIIGSIQVSDIELAHILKVLKPIWETKNETAMRLRGRLEMVLDAAKVQGLREGENPARWKGHLENVLANISRKARTKHHAALPYDDMGAFMADLRKVEGMSARALEFAILTATRSGEVRGATWAEIDLGKALWIIPKERMKAGKEHHVPLSPAAVELLKALPKIEGNPYVFPGRKAQLSDMSLTAVLKRMQRGDLTAHGFRSSFRDWAGERTNYPREVCEHALAHQLKDKAEAAYQRGSLFDKRRGLMNDWAKYCSMPSAKAGEVVPINAGNAAA